MDTPLAGIQFNDVVVIAGCGPIGLGMIASAKMKNPKSIIALGKELCFKVNHSNLLT
jgi:threonine dehydrogenase-like Zn-dependent dehydrogenase